MKIGVSSASLYPLHAEDAFAELAALGVRCAELFANSTCADERKETCHQL